MQSNICSIIRMLFLKVFTVRAEHFAQERNYGKKEDEQKRDSSEGGSGLCLFTCATVLCLSMGPYIGNNALAKSSVT